jgi:acyl-homoserine lactone acylase PvdQ
MVVEMADPNAGLWMTEVAGVSGHRASPHYADQIDPWVAGELKYTALKGDVEGAAIILESK